MRRAQPVARPMRLPHIIRSNTCEDSDEMNILPPHLNPKATDHIPEMLSMTEKLIEKGLAYVANGNVYYDVSRFPGYGKLSGNTVENLRDGRSWAPANGSCRG